MERASCSHSRITCWGSVFHWMRKSSGSGEAFIAGIEVVAGFRETGVPQVRSDFSEGAQLIKAPRIKTGGSASQPRPEWQEKGIRKPTPFL